MPTPTDTQHEIAAGLCAAFEEVRIRTAARWGDGVYTGTSNPRGDRQLEADVEADAIAARALAERFGNLVLLSEERDGPLVLPMGPGRIDCGGRRVVLDPIDGSRNHARGLPFPGFAVAVMDPDGPLAHEAVEIALVGSLFPHDLGPIARRGASALVGVRGRGVRVLGEACEAPAQIPVRPSGCTSLREAAVAVELHGHAPGPWFPPLCDRAWTVRVYGATAMSIVSVALGRLDAYVDATARLTPENDLAAGRIVLEAGGVAVAPDGGPVAPAHTLKDGRDAIFAATPELADEIRAVLRGP